jgi:phosphoethanolamine N-methyltransferase
MATNDIQYPDEFINRLEVLWGEGFLSPGGAEEVKEIVKGLDLSGKSVLDIGCGTGGVDIVLARDLGAGKVTAIDVEPQLIERAKQRAVDAGIAEQTEFILIEPGPLEFERDSFDLVFSKDAMIHIPDKDALFRDVLRILRPGGAFAASDWLVGENAATSPEWERLSNLTHLSFEVATGEQTAVAIQNAGFEQVSTVDRNAWYAPITILEMEQLEGPLRDSVLDVVDQSTYENWMKVRRAIRDATGAGALRPTHMRGFKPA